MSKNIIRAAFVAAFAFVAGYCVYTSQLETEMSGTSFPREIGSAYRNCLPCLYIQDTGNCLVSRCISVHVHPLFGRRIQTGHFRH